MVLAEILEAIEALYREGKLVKALDESGEPLLRKWFNERSGVLWDASVHARDTRAPHAPVVNLVDARHLLHVRERGGYARACTAEVFLP